MTELSPLLPQHGDEPQALDAQVLARLEQAAGGGAALLVSVAAPLLSLDRVFAALPSDERLMWAPPDGPGQAAAGVAQLITAEGDGRFSRIRQQGVELLGKLRGVALPGAAPALPRLHGGFAFQPGRAGSPAWARFGDARFVLPRWCYTRRERSATLTLAVTSDELRAEDTRLRLAAELGSLHAALCRPEPKAPADEAVVAERPPSAVSLDNGFFELISAIREAIHEGRFEKVVAAQRMTLDLAEPPSLPSLLDRLRAQSGGSTRFVLQQGEVCFLGATPERLVRKTGAVIETEALAGSRPAGDGGAKALLESAKDASEHAIVVRELLAALKPVASSIHCPSAPEVRRLRHLLHLWTPIRAELSEPEHVLDLVARLHPTPAVGGTPRDGALEWIRTREPAERGWYAGPVGWFDRNGDGEFVVALRSALLQGARAHLYAGAGIVKDSDPASEQAETELKLQSMLAALGVSA